MHEESGAFMIDESEPRVPAVEAAPLPRPPPPTREASGIAEARLLARIRRGDPRAFGEVVRLHQHKVFNLLLRMLGDSAEAEDVAQEVFVSLHQSLPKFRGDSKLSTWLYRVARNHCLNRIKYLGRRDAGPLPEREEMAPPEGIPDRLLERRERDVIVQRAIAELPEEQREVVVLRDIEGLSYEEIAKILEQPEGTVKSRIHRGRAALAARLSALAEEEP